jgi:hypothetical protein
MHRRFLHPIAVIIVERTLSINAHPFRVNALGPVLVKGMAEPVTVFELISAGCAVPASHLLTMMAPNGVSSASRIRLSRRAIVVARKSATR